MNKENYAIVLEYLPNGYPLEKKMMPIAQAVGKNNLILLELVPRRGETIEIGEEVYIGEGKRDKISYILGRLKREKLGEAAKTNLEEYVHKYVKSKEKELIDFYNKSDPINKRVHQIELLPGMGKKHMKEILEKREQEEFKSFEDLRNRIPHLPDPEKAIEKRIIEELTTMQRYNLFVN